MKNSFTILELLIVIVVISILASVAFVSYGDMAERSRASEAKEICSRIKDAEELYILYNDEATENFTNLGLVNIPEGIPTGFTTVNCASNEHYFIYKIWLTPPDGLDYYHVIAYRCTSGGKYPETANYYFISLDVDRTTGGTEWSGRFSD